MGKDFKIVGGLFFNGSHQALDITIFLYSFPTTILF